jgi:hypothetical protein
VEEYGICGGALCGGSGHDTNLALDSMVFVGDLLPMRRVIQDAVHYVWTLRHLYCVRDRVLRDRLMMSDKAKAEDVKSQAELEAILEGSDWQVVRGDRGTVLALVPRGLSLQGWRRLLDYVLDTARTLGRVGS